MMEQRVFHCELDGRAVLGFDTGLDSRSFAQAKFAQCITEPGLIVRAGGGIEPWNAAGVVELDSSMVIWGPAFAGECLPALITVDEHRDAALAALAAWIEAVLAVEKDARFTAPARFSAAMIGAVDGVAVYDGAVFFAPDSLALRCMTSDGADSYVHPDLRGVEAAAFSAAAMLYRVLAGTSPFPAADTLTLHQDMRDAHFVPPHLAIPGLDTRLAALIRHALGASSGKAGKPRAAGAALEAMLAIVRPAATADGGPNGRTISVDALIQPVEETRRLALEKEKHTFLKITAASVQTRRFVIRNSLMLFGCLAAAVTVTLIVFSLIRSRAQQPTTAGMEPVEVIEHYYHAFNELDHTMMEACVTNDAGEDDIGMVINMYVMNKMKQAYEINAPPLIVSAREWQERGSPPDIQPFGVTDLRAEPLPVNGGLNTAAYRVYYNFWIPPPMNEGIVPPRRHSDAVILSRIKEQWRISEIIREQLEH